jgi:hypothetical protein
LRDSIQQVETQKAALEAERLASQANFWNQTAK